MLRIPNNYKPHQLNLRVNYKEFRPVSLLDNIVSYYWQLTALENEQYTVIPDGCVDLLSGIYADNEVYVSVSLYSQRKISLSKGQKILGLRFLPSVFSTLFKIPVNELYEQKLIRLRDLKNASLIQDFCGRWMETTDDIEIKIPLIEQFLLKHIGKENPNSDMHLLNALSDIYEQKGNILIEDRKNFTVSPRQLRRIFNQYVGFSPKEFSNIVKFQSVLKELKNGQFYPSCSTYFDQSHLIREVKKYTGYTPQQLYRSFH